MSTGGKKFNIWIAYSDLFTNLSTFLFISALGLFAAFGSSTFAQLGPGGSARCTVRSDIGDSVTGASALLEYVGSARESRFSCSEYYLIKDHAFVSANSGRGDFRHLRTLQPLSAERIFADICRPIWLAIPRKDFVGLRGRVVFQGIGSKDNSWRYQPQCQQLSRDAPRIDHPSFPEGWSAITAVNECDRPDRYDTAFLPFCRDIAKCRDPASQKLFSLCAQVAAVREWEAFSAATCRREAAQLQARTLYRMCERTPTNANFPDLRYLEDVFVEDARFPERRARFWGNVDYNAPIYDASAAAVAAAAKGRLPLHDQPGGSVVVELRFGR